MVILTRKNHPAGDQSRSDFKDVEKIKKIHRRILLTASIPLIGPRPTRISKFIVSCILARPGDLVQ